MFKKLKKMKYYVFILGLIYISSITSAASASLPQSKTAALVSVVTNLLLSDTTVTSVPEVEITHDGLIYRTVTSPHTGKIWLDRNLGATRVCEVFSDSDCYGDYYQWGRNRDGHQNSSGTTDIQATDINNAGSLFITAIGTTLFDWAQAADSTGVIRSNNWSKTDGTAVCPTDFRVPTFAEISAELSDPGSAEIANYTDAFNSFLKLPSSSGHRNFEDGSFPSRLDGTLSFYGSIWSTTIHDDSPFSSSNYRVTTPFWAINRIETRANRRAEGIGVRCLRD